MKYDFIITWADGVNFTFHNCESILEAIGKAYNTRFVAIVAINAK